jgi:hypothetical protein
MIPQAKGKVDSTSLVFFPNAKESMVTDAK